MQNLENTGYFQSETWAWCADIFIVRILLHWEIKATCAFSLYAPIPMHYLYVILHPCWSCLLQIQISWEIQILDITLHKRHNLLAYLPSKRKKKRLISPPCVYLSPPHQLLNLLQNSVGMPCHWKWSWWCNF
jgi:hypothetical protein